VFDNIKRYQNFIFLEDIMQVELKGKTALVTGSTSGIGLAIAKTLARNGANILFNGFGDANEIDKIVKGVAQEHGVKTFYHNADMSKASEIEAMMQFANDKMGGVDILVNNAGVQHVASIEDFPTEKWDSIIAINLTSAFHTTRLALPGMKAKNWGRIINVASVHGLVASTQKSAYVASKHGIIGFTKVTALETAQTPITCNAICPGWVLTPLVQKQVDARAEIAGISIEEAKKMMLAEKQPSGVLVTPEQLGELVAFLCTAATGQMRSNAIQMDGGWLAQ
jgi:3-hydroxybutyrate dehydrogenase